jgi:hypothetical protein
MEVLLWLAPAGVATVLAMLWAGWQGRRQERVLDRDEAVRRLGRALEQPARTHDRPGAARAPRPVDRSTAVAVRRTPAPRPQPRVVPPPVAEPGPQPTAEATAEPVAEPSPEPRAQPRPRPVAGETEHTEPERRTA